MHVLLVADPLLSAHATHPLRRAVQPRGRGSRLPEAGYPPRSSEKSVSCSSRRHNPDTVCSRHRDMPLDRNDQATCLESLAKCRIRYAGNGPGPAAAARHRNFGCAAGKLRNRSGRLTAAGEMDREVIVGAAKRIGAASSLAATLPPRCSSFPCARPCTRRIGGIRPGQ